VYVGHVLSPIIVFFPRSCHGYERECEGVVDEEEDDVLDLFVVVYDASSVPIAFI
jgi:hypothetical protein